MVDIPGLLSDDELRGHWLRVSALDASGVRLDMTIASSGADVSEGGLLPLRHRNERRPDLPHINMTLATLGPFSIPLESRVRSGEQADDPVPVFDRWGSSGTGER